MSKRNDTMSTSESTSGRSNKIKPFRSQRRMDDQAARAILSDLKDAIAQIHNQNASALSFEELYRNAYNLVLHKHGDKLYNGIKGEVTDHLAQVGSSVVAVGDNELLSALVEKWRTHTTTMRMITDILMYMDRTFVVQEKREPVYDLGLRVFRDEVLRHEQVKGRVLKALLDDIRRERNGELVEQDVLRNVLQMLVDLGISSMSVYEEDFEAEFMRATQAFYHDESARYVSTSTCSDYIARAEQRLDDERQRAHNYLHYSTEEKLLRLVADELVGAHAAHLVDMENSGCRVMLRDDKLQDLARMYRLFEHKNCRAEIKQCMKAYVQEQGEKLVDDDKSDFKPVDFVQQLLELQSKFDRIVSEAFQGDKQFQKAVKGAFEFFVNKNQRCSRYLSMYLDELMRSKIKPTAVNSETDVNARVDKVVEIFRYLQDKDIFESFYKQQLAKRLLGGRSISEDAEMAVIKKLKTECGYLFTSKLEGMFKDIRLSRKTMQDFSEKQPRRQDDIESPELSVTVLTSGFWPTESAQACNLPAPIKEAADNFESFYLGSHNGRRLTWQTNLGSADMKAFFANGKVHEFNVSTYQMCVLNLFNPDNAFGGSLTWQQICDAVGVDAKELGRHVISLTTSKAKILNKEPKGRTLTAETSFTVNGSFKSAHYRMRVPLVSTRENIGGDSSKHVVPESVAEDRRHLIEAAIVRIMKARKQLEHNLLIAEVTKQMSSRFNPSPSDIKKRLESLLEREYLERTDDRRVYRYLA